MKKSRLATAAVAAVVVGTIGFSVPAFGASGYGAVNVEKTDNVVTIGNDALSRTFSIKDNKLKPGKIDNKLAGEVSFTPGDKSEEFTIGLMPSGARVEPENDLLTSVKPSRASLTAKAKGSSEDASESAVASKAIDGDANSYWASTEHNVGTANIEIDFGSKKSVKRVEYTARHNNQDNTYDSTGTIHEYKLEYHDGSDWVEAKTGSFSNIASTGKGVIELDREVEATKIRLTAVKSHHWKAEDKNKYASAAEIDALDANGVSAIHGSSAWKAKVSSSSSSAGDNGGADALIDSDPNTYWHSNYGQGDGEANKLPVTVTIDRGASKAEFQTVGYLPRPTSGNGNW